MIPLGLATDRRVKGRFAIWQVFLSTREEWPQLDGARSQRAPRVVPNFADPTRRQRDKLPPNAGRALERRWRTLASHPSGRAAFDRQLALPSPINA
jgi:hypothetical protein